MADGPDLASPATPRLPGKPSSGQPEILKSRAKRAILFHYYSYPILALNGTEGAGTDAQARLTEFLEKARHQRAKMARNLAQADEFIHRLNTPHHG